MSASAIAQAFPIRQIPISSIRRDGNTQHRTELNLAVVEEYSALMQEGVVFPPTIVWWDSRNYWLTDGFHRLAAAERLGLTSILAEIRNGALEDAQWHSYSVNTTHGLRRTSNEAQRVIGLALEHPNSSSLSNVELGRHLHLPESTIRRWRVKIVPSESNGVRLVTRGGKKYCLATDNIGRHSSRPHLKSRDELKKDIDTMKAAASPLVRRILNIFNNWALATATPAECLAAIEGVLQQSRQVKAE